MPTMRKRRDKLTDGLRAAVDASGMTRAEICRRLGWGESLMSRFMAGTSGLSFASIDALGELLRLTITAKARKGKRKGR